MPKIVLNAVQKVLEPLPIRGKAYIADAILKHVTSAIECHPVPGVTISLRPQQRIERWMWAGGYERDLVRLLRQTLKPGMIVLDLGANIGYFSAIAAALVTQSGHVHSFEPMPHNFSQLEANVSTFKWATTYRCAVGAHDGHAIIHFSDREAGWATLLDFDIVSEPLQSQVDVVSLDCWAQRHGIRRVDFIKLDVEGGEYDALKGTMEMLRCFRPTIVSEIKPGFFTEQLYGLLFELGYNWIPFGDGILAKSLSVSATAPCAQSLPEL